MFKKHDWVITTLIIVLSIVGFFTLLSTSIQDDGSIILEGVVSRHMIFICVGLIGYFLLSLFDYKYLKYKQILLPLYIVTIGVLVYVLIAGPQINQVKRWIVIGGGQLQPAEFAKITIILISAAVMTMRTKVNDLLLAGVTFLLLIPILILVYLQPHGSMTLMLLFIWGLTVFTYVADQRRNIVAAAIAILVAVGLLLTFLSSNTFGILILVIAGILAIFAFYAKEGWRIFAIGAVITGLLLGGVGVLSWNNILKDYQKDRIETFFAPEDVGSDQAFNVEQSKVAIGSGGFIGKGFGFGTQSRLKYLPEHQTDFVFATYAEQFGLVGSLFLLGIYAFLIIKIIWTSMKISQQDQFGSMIMFGVGIMLLLEVFINVGTNTGIIPATGIPLPLISSGGSSVIMTLLSMGIVQSVIMHSQKDPDQDSFIDKEDLLI